MVPQTKVFIGSLPQGSRPEDLRKLFERFGTVTECDIMNRCGFVHMGTEDQAAAAIRALHNTSFNGGTITVERGRIKERGQRGPGGGGGRGGVGGRGRGGFDRRGGGGGPMRGGQGANRDAPYMRDRVMRGPMGGGNGYDRGAPVSSYDDGYNGYGGDDRRGYSMSHDPYAAAPMYDDRRGGYGAPVDAMGGYPEDHRQPMYRDDPYDQHTPMAREPISSGYDRAPPRAAMGNPDMFSRRSPPMRGAPVTRDPYAQPYDRDPYTQSYGSYAPPAHGGGGGGGRGGRDGGMRRY